MQVGKNEPVAPAKQENDRVFPIRHALLMAGTLGSLASIAFLVRALVFSGNPIASLFGGLFGVSLGLSALSAITQRRVHPCLAAIMGAAFVPALSATLMIACLLLFDPGLFSRGAVSHGQTFDDKTVWWLIFLFVILPISLIVGPIVGCRLNRRSAKS